MVGELRFFSPYEVFPKSKKEFKSLYAPYGVDTTEFSDFRLKTIEYDSKING